MSIAAVLILAWLAFVVGVIVGTWLTMGVPECTCGDPDCGGGCIGREDDMPPARHVDPWLQTR